MILVIVLLVIAGIMKAVKDRLDNPYTKHIFPTWGTFWEKGTGKKVLGYYFDAWHLAHTIYILCFCIIGGLYYRIVPGAAIWTILIFFAITQLAFNLFYLIFKKNRL